MAMVDGDFDCIRDLVHDQSALTLEAGKEYLVESRHEPLARRQGFPSYQQLVARLRIGPFGDLHRKAVEAMTNNETSFFRDARVFGMLTKSILPTLLAERSAERSLTIWCAACSTGQEPYSVAMLIREQFPSVCAAAGTSASSPATCPETCSRARRRAATVSSRSAAGFLRICW
jgi:chemotaxis protein methyltransferase CheR